MKAPNGLAPIARLMRRVRFDDSGCWVWTGCKIWGGYGRMGVSRKCKLVHRLSYEHAVGPIPIGYDLDHLCRNRACVRPTHLEPVTRRENVVRGVSPNAVNARKTHCKHGHALTPDNLYANADTRQCKTCAQLYSKAQTALRRMKRGEIGQTNDLASAERNALALSRAIEEIG